MVFKKKGLVILAKINIKSHTVHRITYTVTKAFIVYRLANSNNRKFEIVLQRILMNAQIL